MDTPATLTKTGGPKKQSITAIPLHYFSHFFLEGDVVAVCVAKRLLLVVRDIIWLTLRFNEGATLGPIAALSLLDPRP